MRYKLFLYLFIFISQFFLAGFCESSEWISVAPYNYVYKDGIVKNDDFTYSVLLKSYNKGQYEPVNNKHIAYVLSRYEINCKDSTYKFGLIDSYDDSGNFVNGDYNKYATFLPIVPDSTIFVLYNNLCKISD